MAAHSAMAIAIEIMQLGYSLLKNRKWGSLFYLTLSDISGIA